MEVYGFMLFRDGLEKINAYVGELLSFSWFQRLFFWGKARAIQVEIAENIGSLKSELGSIEEKYKRIEASQNELKIKFDSEKNQNNELRDHNLRLQTEKKELQKDLGLQSNTVLELEKKLSAWEESSESRRKDFERNIHAVNSLEGTLKERLQEIQTQREKEIEDNYEKLRNTWRTHEDKVENIIRSVAERNQIEYINGESFPGRGKPDNCLRILDEYVVFDAKAPQNDDLSHIRAQTENVKKYIKEDGVRKDVYLVIPVNTLDLFENRYFNMRDYNVYLVSPDALEPVIKSLKKIEDYEFAEQLSPEDRENICRVIGAFAHATKRRIQVDSYFATEFSKLLTDGGSLLPQGILELSREFEKHGKLNPPQEKRSKLITDKELEENIGQMEDLVQSKSINNKNMEILENIPLFKEEQ
jgi:hypothetical protein